MAGLGVILSCQPAFEAYWGGPGRLYQRRLGPRYRRTNRFKTALAAGIRLAGGSDANITPIDPLAGIAAAMNHPQAEERLSFAEALGLFTGGAAFAVFAENDLGDLAPGKHASFTVVAEDPRALPPDALARLPVVATAVAGRVVFERSSP
jgi:predicted amidohydrolase YtcJ